VMLQIVVEVTGTVCAECDRPTDCHRKADEVAVYRVDLYRVNKQQRCEGGTRTMMGRVMLGTSTYRLRSVLSRQAASCLRR